MGREVYGTEDRIKISANFLQMVGACLFHFDLYLTVFRVYIIELLLTAFPQQIDSVQKTAPVIDYQPGSLRDDFNFGSVLLFNFTGSVC